MKKKSGLIWGVVGVILLAFILTTIAIIYVPSSDNDQEIEIGQNVKLLYFGKDTFDSSIQSEELRLDWDKHLSTPADTSLTQMWINEDPYFTMSMPEWNDYRYGTTVILYQTPIYIAFTARETNKDLQKETIENLSEFEKLVRLRGYKNETLQLGNFEVQKSLGTCNAETNIIELRQYVSYTFQDGRMQYYFIGVTPRGSETTIHHIAEAIEKMIQSIGFEGLA